MFKENKYTKWYYTIIHNAKRENRSRLPIDDKSYIYYESHHVIPECMGGSETVFLTGREHFICHLLLTKMTDDRRMKYAAKAMTMHNKRRGLKVSSHTYAYIKKIHAESVSDCLKNKPKTNEHKAKLSAIMKTKVAPNKGKKLGPNPCSKQRMTGNMISRGRIWITDGINNKMIYPGDIPDGYYKGKTQRKHDAKLYMDEQRNR